MEEDAELNKQEGSKPLQDALFDDRATATTRQTAGRLPIRYIEKKGLITCVLDNAFR